MIIFSKIHISDFLDQNARYMKLPEICKPSGTGLPGVDPWCSCFGQIRVWAFAAVNDSSRAGCYGLSNGKNTATKKSVHSKNI